ncbi:MAG: glucose-6-phosphate isomerase [Alphaproteobacteria bacterium]|nr:glucose-6-phosphate isomerase [Alphaproteobacteria bacterium]
MTGIADTAEWRDLVRHAETLKARRTTDLFAADPQRAADFSVEAAGVFLDFSKNKISREALAALLALANAVDVAGGIKRMVSGERINATENRAVLHVALRDFANRAYDLDGENLAQAVRAERARMVAFADAYAKGDLLGFTGEPLDTVVNIGIGGSDLGPRMVVDALKPYWLEGKRTFFVSNVDGRDLGDALDRVDPARTLFVIASKTFTTQETMTNASSARAWFLANGGAEETVARHFVALSTNERAVTAFGIDPANMFRFWDWVGGRFSLWSAIGLSIALQVGSANFERLLRGAHAMDEHFRSAPPAENLPVLLALVGVWTRNFQGVGAHAVLPYDQRLARLPAFLQQADMESNGKSVSLSGAPVGVSTGPIVFGEPGTNGQHAFYQLLHQGTDIVSADFIAAASTHNPIGDHHEKLLANFVAQPEALMVGKTEKQVWAELEKQDFPANEIERIAPHRAFHGDRPSNSILVDRLTPEALGAVIAMYEHKIFVQGLIWGVNSFDQWGVALGKELAKRILPKISPSAPPSTDHDASTNQIIDRINALRSAGTESENQKDRP